MTTKPDNPTTEEEVKAERNKICEDLMPHLLYRDPYDENRVEYYLNICDKIKNPVIKFVPKNDNFDASIVYPDAPIAALSLEDYQSVCVQHNIDYTTSKLISLCAQGKTEEADKIVPGFSEKYQSLIDVKDTNYNVKGDVYKQMQEDVRQNFAENNPDFLKDTEKQWRQDRAEQMLTDSDVDSIPINDNTYYVVAKKSSTYYRPSEEVNKATAELRQSNDAIVQQMRDNEGKSKQATKQTMKNDADRAHEAGDHEAQKAKNSKTHTTAQTKQTQQSTTASKQTTNSAQPNVMAAVINQYRGR
ncbi:MAG: hypothetical protein VZR95_02670 [Alphaproteobacteria bacterium]